MKITVDSNVLLSIFAKDSLFDRSSILMEKYSAHEYIINDCIYLELGVHFPKLKKLDESLNILEVTVFKGKEIDYEITLDAWKSYLQKKKFVCPTCKKIIHPVCPRCQETLTFRQRILTDFFIGGFASANSDGLITLDPTYYKNYFPELVLFD